MSEKLIAVGEMVYYEGDSDEDPTLGQFYGEPDLAKQAVVAVNAFAALADHLGCDPAELEKLDLVKLVQTAQDAHEAIAKFPKPDGEAIAHGWIDLADTLLSDIGFNLSQALAQFVDRADIGHEE